jgi:hypothetical protein
MESIYANTISNNNLGNNIILIGNINIINQTIINQNVINQTINITNISGDDEEKCYSDVEFEYATDEEKCYSNVEFEYATDEEKCYSEFEVEYATDEEKYKTKKSKKSKKSKKEKKAKEVMVISQQQIKAANDIIEAFKDRRWVILTAQMQSGKTTTYYLTAAIMLMLRLVNKVIIFSGNAEIELREQINESKKKFLKSLRRNLNILNNYNLGEYDDIEDLFDDIEENIEIIWGRNMEKYEYSPDDTVFYIWDESHYAQNKGMGPEKFLKSQGIYAHGDEYNLEENDCYMLSVSATPFSEISDNKHQNQNKTIINLEVDDEQYHGVKKMVQNGLIHSYDYTEWKTHLSKTLKRHTSSSPKYALLRLRDSLQINVENAMKIIKRCGWKHKIFDSSKSNQLENIQKLEDEPEENTVIIMKAKCRMGKVVPKQFIAFCMETSKNPNTDVVLQGLLGRMCGYHSYNDVEIHLCNEVVESTDGSTEFERYVRYIELNDVIPRKANNIVSGKTITKSSLHPIIPIKIRFDEFPEDVRSEVQALFNEIYENSRIRVYDDIVQNYNNRQQTDELVRRLAMMSTRKMIVKRINGQRSYVNVPRIINESIETQTPKSLGSSCGIEAEDNETVVIWVFEEDYEDYNIVRGDVFIDARTEENDPEIKRKTTETRMIPLTTKRETFYRRR